jgi:hypothetical protein
MKPTLAATADRRCSRLLVETIAIQYGAEAKSEGTLEALRIVEICRKASLGAGLLAENRSPELGENPNHIDPDPTV